MLLTLYLDLGTTFRTLTYYYLRRIDMGTPIHVVLDDEYGSRFKEILNSYGLLSYAIRDFSKRLVLLHDNPELYDKYKDKPLTLIKDAASKSVDEVLPKDETREVK